MQKFGREQPKYIFEKMPEFFQEFIISISNYTGIDKFLIITIILIILLASFKVFIQELNNK